MLALVDVHVLHAFAVDRRVQELLQIAGGEAGVVFDFSRERELPERQRALQAILLGDRAFEHERFQLGPRSINRSRPTGRSAAHDDHVLSHNASLLTITRQVIILRHYRRGVGRSKPTHAHRCRREANPDIIR